MLGLDACIDERMRARICTNTFGMHARTRKYATPVIFKLEVGPYRAEPDVRPPGAASPSVKSI